MREPTPRPTLPLAAAVLTLLLLASAMAWIGQGIRTQLAEIVEVIEPASRRVHAIQRLLTHEPGEAVPGADPVERELAGLRGRAALLGGPAVGGYARLRAGIEGWRAAPRGSPAAAGRLADALDEAEHLHALLDRLVVERRQRVLLYERLEVALVVGTSGLALLALTTLLRFGARQRTLFAAAEALARESREQRTEVERMVAQKEAFLRGVSHDMRDPLSTIDAYAELLVLRTDPSGEEGRYVERIRRASQELLGIVNGLLELARADAERRPVEAGPANTRGPADGS